MMKVRHSSYQIVIYCLFIISGSVKFLLTYLGFPIDITLLTALLLCVDVIYTFVVKKTSIRFSRIQWLWLLSFFGFYVLFFISLSYTPSAYYAYKKTAYFLLCVLAVVYPLFIVRFDLKLFVRIVKWTAVPFSLCFIVMRNLYWSSSYTEIIGKSFGPLTGAYGGLSLLIALLVFWAAYQGNIRGVIFYLLLFVVLGSRGGAIFSVIILGITYRHQLVRFFARYNFGLKMKKIDLLILCGAGVALIFFTDQLYSLIVDGLYRFTSFIHFSEDNSSNERIAYYKFAIDKITASFQPFFTGHGIGSFDLLHSGQDGRDIPHNIFLEAGFEVGIVAVLLLAIVVIVPLLLKHRNIVLKMICVFLFLEEMKSGGFDEMRYTFGMLSLLMFVKIPPDEN